MARLRFMAVALLALALTGNSTQKGRSEGQNLSLPSPAVPANAVHIPMSMDEPAADQRSCVIYSLTDMGYDADLGEWIAQTIPEMIEPSSWKESGGAGVLRYYPPKNILIVNHTAAVQTKVENFFKKLKTSLPKTSSTKFAANNKPSRDHVVPAQYQAPETVRTSNPLPEPSGYPVPAPVKAPKHLFHFLIRYEGEGLIDDNVVKFMKGYVDASKDGTSPAPVAAAAHGVLRSSGTHIQYAPPNMTGASPYCPTPPPSSVLQTPAPAAACPVGSSTASPANSYIGFTAPQPTTAPAAQPKKPKKKKDAPKDKSDDE